MKLIVAAMEEEVKAIVDHMDQVRVCSHAGVRLYEGMLEGEACTVMKSGVGKGSCAMTLTIALERLGSVDAVINIGTAGGILDTEEVLDLVISTAVVQHDYDTSPIDGEDGIGLWFEADARLQRAASEAAHGCTTASSPAETVSSAGRMKQQHCSPAFPKRSARRWKPAAWPRCARITASRSSCFAHCLMWR